MDGIVAEMVTVTLPADAALVLDALFAGVDEPGPLQLSGPAELQAVWALSASLERVLVDTFRPEYKEFWKRRVSASPGGTVDVLQAAIAMSAYNRADLEGIHKHSSRHRGRVEQSDVCGCFYCLAFFTPSEIVDWIDVTEGADDEAGVTALCPRCGIDSVLPDNVPGAPLSPELLAAMQRHWFKRNTRVP